MRFELIPPSTPEPEPMPDDFYEEPCDECGGKVRAIGGSHWYNGQYDCYTLVLECENCGIYDVECV